MTKKHLTIPPQAMEPDFITALRTSYVHRDPTAQRLSIVATLADDLGRTYLDQALSVSREEIREILLGKFNYQPEEPEEGDFPFDDDDEPAPDHRAPAASLFLYGVAANYWTATAEETELARALIITRYGKDALEMLTPEKTKDDLAREAGVPNKTFIHKMPQDSRSVKQFMADYFCVRDLSAEADRIAANNPKDIDAIGVALKRYLDALKQYFPHAYEMQVAYLRRTLAPAVAKFYVELVKSHDHQARPT